MLPYFTGKIRQSRLILFQNKILTMIFLTNVTSNKYRKSFKISNVCNIYLYPIAWTVHIPLTKAILQFEYTLWIRSTLPVFFSVPHLLSELYFDIIKCKEI